MLDKVVAIIERETGEKVTPETRMDSLDLDSLEYFELLLEIDKETGIASDKSLHFETVADFA